MGTEIALRNGGALDISDLSDRVTSVNDTSSNSMDRLHVTFANGYTISIIRGEYSYGGRDGLFEIAIMVDGEITYETPIANNVIGWLTTDGVASYAREVASLPAV